jgi:hypothetical protein
LIDYDIVLDPPVSQSSVPRVNEETDDPLAPIDYDIVLDTPGSQSSMPRVSEETDDPPAKCPTAYDVENGEFP